MTELFDITDSEDGDLREIDLDSIVEQEGITNLEEKMKVRRILRHLLMHDSNNVHASEPYSYGEQQLNYIIDAQVDDELNLAYDTYFGVESPQIEQKEPVI